MKNQIILIGIGSHGNRAIQQMIDLGILVHTIVIIQDAGFEGSSADQVIRVSSNQELGRLVDYVPLETEDLMVIMVGDLRSNKSIVDHLIVHFKNADPLVRIGLMGIVPPSPEPINIVKRNLFDTFRSFDSFFVFPYDSMGKEMGAASTEKVWNQLIAHVCGAIELVVNGFSQGFQKAGGPIAGHVISDIWGEFKLDNSLLVGTGSSVGEAFDQVLKLPITRKSDRAIMSLSGAVDGEIEQAVALVQEKFGEDLWVTVGPGGCGDEVRMALVVWGVG